MTLTAAELDELRAAALTLLEASGAVRRLVGGMWTPIATVPCWLGAAQGGGQPSGQPLEAHQYAARLVTAWDASVRPGDRVLVSEGAATALFHVDTIDPDRAVQLVAFGRAEE